MVGNICCKSNFFPTCLRYSKSKQYLIVLFNFFVKVWDVRTKEVLYELKGHTDTVTGLSLSGDGSYLLSNSMDNSLRIWDIRPYAPMERCVKVFSGHQHNFEKNLLR